MLRNLFSIFACLIIILSCNQEEKPLTKEESLDFGKKVETSIGRRLNKFLDEAIDEKAIFKKMDLKPGKEARSVLAGLKKGIRMGSKISESLSAEGTYSLIKNYEKNKVQHLIFRLYDQGMINYHDYELKRTNGQPKVADIYIYLTGENLSETLKNVMMQLSDIYKESPDIETDKGFKRITEIRSLITAGKHQQALDIFQRIPEKIKNSRIFQIVHVEICSGLDEMLYNKAIEEYETLFPNEPNMQLLLIDAHILRKDYKKALTAVNELDKMIDKDPLLDFHRAMCYSLMNEYEKKMECLQRLVKNLPDFETGVSELLTEYLEAGQFEKAKPLVDDFKIRSAFNQSTLNMLLIQYPGYNEKYGDN